jgi:hypothetical protein
MFSSLEMTRPRGAQLQKAMRADRTLRCPLAKIQHVSLRGRLGKD